MMVPFHLHFYVRNPQETEQRFIDILTMNVEARYGLSKEGHLRFAVDEGWNAFDQGQSRFRFTHLVAGTFDVVLGASNREEPILEHFGLYVNEAEYARCKAVFQSSGLSLQEGERRSFFTTQFGVRMELVGPHQMRTPTHYLDNESDLQLELLRVGVQKPATCQQFFTDALGEEFLRYVDFEPGPDEPGFHTIEVHLKSGSNINSRVDEILPGTRWYF